MKKALTLFLGFCAAAMTVIILPRCFDGPSAEEIGALAAFAMLAVGLLLLARRIDANPTD